MDPSLPFHPFSVFLCGIGISVYHESCYVPFPVDAEVFDVDVRSFDVEIRVVRPVSGIGCVDLVSVFVDVWDAVQRQIVRDIGFAEALDLLAVHRVQGILLEIRLHLGSIGEPILVMQGVVIVGDVLVQSPKVFHIGPSAEYLVGEESPDVDVCDSGDLPLGFGDDLQGETMECSRFHHLFGLLADPALQLIDGCVGERQEQDIFGPGLAREEELLDKADYRGGLPGARACDDQPGTYVIADGGQLLPIQVAVFYRVDGIPDIRRQALSQPFVVRG